MPLGTLERTPPPLFKQGPSALSRLIFYCALALFLMVADSRFQIARPLRAGLATALYPAQWLLLQPIRFVEEKGAYLQTIGSLEASEREARKLLAEQSARALKASQLEEENAQLRSLLLLGQRTAVPGRAAEVLYFSADSFRRKIVIDQGRLANVFEGSPVIDEAGVLGQVTRVYPLVSEVTLLVDRDQAIPVRNARPRGRSVAYGEPAAPGATGGGLELRFMASDTDVEVGDLLVTSGGDGVYPSGLPVATVEKVVRRADSAFARIRLMPVARIAGVRYVMVLDPAAERIPPLPTQADDPAVPVRNRARGGIQ